LFKKRNERGKKTASDYRNRLALLIEFAESEELRKRWPTAATTDGEFAVQFRAFPSQRLVIRNGRAALQIETYLSAPTLQRFGLRPDSAQFGFIASIFRDKMTEHSIGNSPVRAIAGCKERQNSQ
jgi:hypothetical protein